jgi:hypothetical protein
MDYEKFKIIALYYSLSEFEFDYNNQSYFWGRSNEKKYIIATQTDIIFSTTNIQELFDFPAFDGVTLKDIWSNIEAIHWDGLGDADNWYDQLVGDNLFSLLCIVNESRLGKVNFFETLHQLSSMEKNNHIVLYAGTYSIAKATEKTDIEQATFYIYEKRHQVGFVLSNSRMGVSFDLDKGIFKFKHRYLYNKNHLSNTFFGEPDQRIGEFFNSRFFGLIRSNKK